MSEIGKNKEDFEVQLHKDFFNLKDIISIPSGKKLQVLNEPKSHYNKWYWRVLNFITFKKLFNVRYTYKVKEIK